MTTGPPRSSLAVQPLHGGRPRHEGLPVPSPVLGGAESLSDPRRQESSLRTTKKRGRWDDTASETDGPVHSDSPLWTLNERLVVLLALCNYMRAMSRSMARVQFLYQECEKLRTIAGAPSRKGTSCAW